MPRTADQLAEYLAFAARRLRCGREPRPADAVWRRLLRLLHARLGFVDAIVEASLQHYDTKALIPIIKGAGGVVSAWDGSSAQNGGAVVACGDPCLHALLVEHLRHAS